MEMHGHQGTPTPEHVRQALHRAGYSPIPVHGKKPAPNGWQKKAETNAEEIALWSQRWEERGYILVRIGRAPKRAILLRTDAPFKKIVGNVIAPDGSEQKIELLADGQQVVVFGIHPDTGKPYSWHGGEPGAVPWEDLPYVTEAEAKAFVDDAVALLVREHGYTVPKPKGDPTPKGKGKIDHQSQTDWASLNSTALQNLAAWVPALLPAAIPKDGCWRVPSKSLGRDLQEDLSITPQGIKDFGIHDQGDAREGKRSPIDLVMEHGQRGFAEAVDWLRERLGLGRGVARDDFYAFMPKHTYIFAPTGDMWPASSINGRLGPGRHLWLDRNKAVEQMTWAPGRQVHHDVIGFVGVDLADVIEPGAGQVLVAELDRRRTVQVEAGSAVPFDPSAVGDEAIPDQLRPSEQLLRRHLGEVPGTDDNGTPRYNFVVAGRGKKNAKSLDLDLAGLHCLLLRESVSGNNCYILANDEGQAADDLDLAKKLIACNSVLAAEVDVFQKEIRRKDGRGSLMILPAKDIAGTHGKSPMYVGHDEIHARRTYDLFEALSPDPTRTNSLVWVTTYDTIWQSPGIPLYDFKAIGMAGTDPRMLFSWYSGNYTTDPAFAELEPELRANPSFASWPDGCAYLDQQRRRLPTRKFQRLHLNLPGAVNGAYFDQAVVMAAIVKGRVGLPSEPGRRYSAFVDMSGGSNDDSTLAIAHEFDGRAVLDLVVKQDGAPPFHPRLAVKKFAEIIRSYGLTSVTGDSYAGETFRQDFWDHHVDYQVCRGRTDSKLRQVEGSTGAPVHRSDLYEALEVGLNAGEVELLDVPVLQQQLLQLVVRGAAIDHEPGAHDDFANAVAGAVFMVRGGGNSAGAWSDYYGDLAKRAHAPPSEDAPVAPRQEDTRPWQTPQQFARAAQAEGNELTKSYIAIRMGLEGAHVAACASCGRALGSQRMHDGVNGWCNASCESAWSAARLARVQALAPPVVSRAPNDRAHSRFV
jgi:Bifunctional DNA primase/polymerase, N-terminal